MKAVDFICEFGWDEAIAAVNLSRLVGIDKSIVDIYDLKKYVDAWELVNRFGGVDGAKGEFFKIVHSGGYVDISPTELRKAIQLVESVGSLSHYEDDLTDHCTNIKNHVSPLTKVIDK